MIQQCPVDYKLEINNKDNSITIKTITANTGGYHTSYHDSTITYKCFLEPTKYFQILPSGDIKFSTQKEFYQTKNQDHSTFHQQRQSYLTNLRRASGFVEKTKGLMSIDIFNGNCLCGTSCCSNDDVFIDDGKTISLEDINKIIMLKGR
ncbi:MAG: hypothetical protein IJT15_01945 [Rickettsiales bacterium]|nr:hypothetical protein [Rickettsiales bacterium]